MDPRGKEIFERLAKTSDVLVENFRPGVMERLGLGYSAIRRLKPDIIYCSLSGYGANGPMRDAPAYDHIVQGVSGLMSLTGDADTGPMRHGVPITDYFAGINAAFAVLTALYQRQATGEGQCLEVTMLAAALPTLSPAFAEYQSTGRIRGRVGNKPFSDSPFAGRFDTADGQIVVTANTTAQALSMVKALAIDTLEAELEVVRGGGALSEQQKAKIDRALDAAFLRRSAVDWEEALAAASVPAGKVRRVDEILSHPQLQAIGTVDRITVEGQGKEIDVPGLAFTTSAGRRPGPSPPEVAGQSTRRILSDLGMDDGELNDLARSGVIAGPDLPQRA